MASLQPLRYVYHDDHLVVIDKPEGLLSVPGRGPEKADCASRRVQADFPDALTVHRLDMATSGLLLFGRGPSMQRSLSILFQRGDVTKLYLADVWGRPSPAAGEISLPLIADWENRPRQKVCHQTGKPSLTRYETARHCQGITRLRLAPLTGRSHQLRVHLASIGHPILGDPFYAHEAAATLGGRLALHAVGLSFCHPADGRRMAFHSDCPF